METGHKNRDDFHCMQMSLVMSMRLFFAMTEMTQFWALDLNLFSVCERHSALDEGDSDYYA